MASRRLARIGGLLAIVASLSAVPAARADLILGTASLSAAQEVPPTGSAAIGVSVLSVDSTTGKFNLTLLVAGIPTSELGGAGANSTPVHLHNNVPGVNGPIVVDAGFQGTITPLDNLGFKLEVTDGTFGGIQGNFNGPDPSVNIANLLGGGLYINVHTHAFGGGEIRGQFSAVPEPSTFALAGLALAGLAVAALRKRAA